MKTPQTDQVLNVFDTGSGPLPVSARLRGYLRYLLFFICVASLFEGYDALITSLALPYLGRDFGLGPQGLGFTMSALQAGTIAAFLLVRLADRYGRRPVFLAVCAGYSLTTVLTALSVGVVDFVAYQFVSRALQVTEVGVGAVILTEELPAQYRGRGVTLMISMATLGGVLGALLFPLVVHTALGWRALYLVGGAFLFPLLLYGARLRETSRWLQERTVPQLHGPEQRPSRWKEDLRLLLGPTYRGRLVAGSTLWFFTCVYLLAIASFFPYYALHERGWSAERVGVTVTIGSVIAFVGYLGSGPLLDIVGRRATASAYFALGAVTATVCFQATNFWMISIFYALAVAMGGVWAISATITAEIFPTHMRATANAVVNNVLGRLGCVLSPSLVGLLSNRLGSVGDAVSVVVWGNVFICVPILLLLLPETRGKALEEIAARTPGGHQEDRRDE